MSPDDFPATYAAARLLEQKYAGGQIPRPATAPIREEAPVIPSGQALSHSTQASSAQELSSTVALTVDVTVNALPAGLPVNISVSISPAGDSGTPDRSSATCDRPSARRADVDLHNRMRRFVPAARLR